MKSRRACPRLSVGSHIKLAARLPGMLQELETVVAYAEQTASLMVGRRDGVRKTACAAGGRRHIGCC